MISLRECLQFSKDDPLDLDFVTAATNLRAAVFTIPLQSKFDVKSIAGNIIPAISTTNAVVAGLQVWQAPAPCHCLARCSSPLPTLMGCPQLVLG